jgi:hypothetical protein
MFLKAELRKKHSSLGQRANLERSIFASTGINEHWSCSFFLLKIVLSTAELRLKTVFWVSTRKSERPSPS